MIDAMRCPGCGSLVEIPAAESAKPKVERVGVLGAEPGRATITLDGEVLHRCEPGRFLPPDRSY